MESGLKQRLIGAAVLVALAVIFLPMLLEAPAPQRGADDVSLDLPLPPATDFETRELPLSLPPQAGVAPTALDSATDNAAPPSASANPTALETTPETAAVNNGSEAAAKPDVDQAVAVTPNRTTEAAPPAATSDAKPTAVPTTPKPPPPRAADQAGRYVLRIGSFSNLASARALSQRLQQAGLPMQQQSIDIDGKPALRLEAGPYAGPAEANSARLIAQRVDASLKPKVLEAEVTPAAVEGSGYAVQLGSFSQPQDANLLRERLRYAGFNAFVVPADTDSGRFYRVRVGPEIERSRAEAQLKQIEAKFHLDGMVVNHP